MVQKYANDPIIASYIAKGVLCLVSSLVVAQVK